MEYFNTLSPSLKFLTVFFFLSVLIYIADFFFALFFVLPLLIKEAAVKNGLVTLRKQMLAEISLYMLVALLWVIILLSRFIFGASETSRYLIVSMIFIASIASSFKILIYRKIYHQTFSEEQKRLHEIIESLEKQLQMRKKKYKHREK